MRSRGGAAHRRARRSGAEQRGAAGAARAERVLPGSPPKITVCVPCGTPKEGPSVTPLCGHKRHRCGSRWAGLREKKNHFTCIQLIFWMTTHSFLTRPAFRLHFLTLEVRCKSRCDPHGLMKSAGSIFLSWRERILWEKSNIFY